MLIIGENLNVINKRIGQALKDRDPVPIREMAEAMTKAGVDLIDLNLGPARKAGAELMEWVVNTVQEVTDVTLSLDTSNVEAMEAGLKVCKRKALINSISARPERMEALMPLAKRYNAVLHRPHPGPRRHTKGRKRKGVTCGRASRKGGRVRPSRGGHVD